MDNLTFDRLPWPLCTDGRLDGRQDDGVSRYSSELVAAMRMIDPALFVVHDAHTLSGRAKTRPEQWRRWLETRYRTGPVPLRSDPAAGRLVGRDVFRRVNVHFDRHGDLLTLATPGESPGIVHWSYPMPVRIAGWANVYTIHDTVPLDQDALTTIDSSRHARVLTAIARDAAAIVTVSNAARDDIARVLPILKGRIHNTSQSVAETSDADAALLPRGLVPGDYYVFCGREEPRKNIPRLIAAWRRSGTARPLVLVGPGQRDVAEDGVIRLPAQPVSVLTALQAHARALLFPSLIEGFGRPIVEAMQVGTPVLTSRGHATEEVAGGAALLVDPKDVAAIADAIGRLDRDDALAAALEMAGRIRARDFTRTAFSRRLMQVYGSGIVNRAGRP